MKRRVILSIRGTQYYQEQDPEVIQLTTEGVMELRDGGWDICYEESELTGLKGVTTTFRVEPDKVILIRSGSLNSQMIFQQGIAHGIGIIFGLDGGDLFNVFFCDYAWS